MTKITPYSQNNIDLNYYNHMVKIIDYYKNAQKINGKLLPFYPYININPLHTNLLQNTKKFIENHLGDYFLKTWKSSSYKNNSKKNTQAIIR